jgi:hypothetical protein
MVTFIPAKDDWAEAGRGFGQGLTAGYMNRSDENAVRKAIQDLGPDADARAILDALTNVKTYRPAAKQQALSNFLGVENFNELKRRSVEQENLIREKNQIAQQLADTKANVKDTKLEDKVAATEGALDILNQMRDIRKKGNLGRGSSYTKFFGGEPAKDFGKYQRLGKSLIQFSSNIPIRNRQEFEVLAEDLYDPTISDDEAEGVLEAMEIIIKKSLNPTESIDIKESKNEKPPLSSFQR